VNPYIEKRLNSWFKSQIALWESLGIVLGTEYIIIPKPTKEAEEVIKTHKDMTKNRD